MPDKSPKQSKRSNPIFTILFIIIGVVVGFFVSIFLFNAFELLAILIGSLILGISTNGRKIYGLILGLIAGIIFSASYLQLSSLLTIGSAWSPIYAYLIPVLFAFGGLVGSFLMPIKSILKSEKPKLAIIFIAIAGILSLVYGIYSVEGVLNDLYIVLTTLLPGILLIVFSILLYTTHKLRVRIVSVLAIILSGIVFIIPNNIITSVIGIIGGIFGLLYNGEISPVMQSTKKTNYIKDTSLLGFLKDARTVITHPTILITSQSNAKDSIKLYFKFALFMGIIFVILNFAAYALLFHYYNFNIYEYLGVGLLFLFIGMPLVLIIGAFFSQIIGKFTGQFKKEYKETLSAGFYSALPIVLFYPLIAFIFINLILSPTASGGLLSTLGYTLLLLTGFLLILIPLTLIPLIWSFVNYIQKLSVLQNINIKSSMVVSIFIVIILTFAIGLPYSYVAEISTYPNHIPMSLNLNGNGKGASIIAKVSIRSYVNCPAVGIVQTNSYSQINLSSGGNSSNSRYESPFGAPGNPSYKNATPSFGQYGFFGGSNNFDNFSCLYSGNPQVGKYTANIHGLAPNTKYSIVFFAQTSGCPGPQSPLDGGSCLDPKIFVDHGINITTGTSNSNVTVYFTYPDYNTT